MKSVATILACIVALSATCVRAAPPSSRVADHPGTPFQTLSEKLDRNLAAVEAIPDAVGRTLGDRFSGARWVSPNWRSNFAQGIVNEGTSVIVLNIHPTSPADVDIVWWNLEGTRSKLQSLTLPPANAMRVNTGDDPGFCVGFGTFFPFSCEGWVEVRSAGGRVVVDGFISLSEPINGSSGDQARTRRTMTWYPVDASATDDAAR